MVMEDKIGRQEFVGKICGLVDSLKKDNHTCIAINGDWGSGKSFVLGMIEEQLSQKAENTVIKYDAWENSFYSDPLIAILSCIIDGIDDKRHRLFGKENIQNAAKAVIDIGTELSPKIKKIEKSHSRTEKCNQELSVPNRYDQLSGIQIIQEAFE